ncbi:hypothetical protein DM860_009152 [Cuscuta australis]|uniref:Uncharacterized protein n=1 Tax=Cuscuta australis TaxID=267555 RepID=A0A328DA90_9ASTE|nr:hypothetical protein DM860_009152 [Cuscuta australis]
MNQRSTSRSYCSSSTLKVMQLYEKTMHSHNCSEIHLSWSSYPLGQQLLRTWSTGASPRIGCVADYPAELSKLVLEERKTGNANRPNQTSVVCALSAGGHGGMLQLGKCIHGYMLRTGLPYDSFTSNALINIMA